MFDIGKIDPNELGDGVVLICLDDSNIKNRYLESQIQSFAPKFSLEMFLCNARSFKSRIKELLETHAGRCIIMSDDNLGGSQTGQQILNELAAEFKADEKAYMILATGGSPFHLHPSIRVTDHNEGMYNAIRAAVIDIHCRINNIETPEDVLKYIGEQERPITKPVIKEFHNVMADSSHVLALEAQRRGVTPHNEGDKYWQR